MNGSHQSFHRKFLWVLIPLLIVWGLTDVRSRAAFDPAHPDRHRTDFTVFPEAGAAFFDGRDPYEVSNPRGWKYLYPPFFALVMAPLHALDPQAQGLVWFFLSLGMAWGCYRESRRLWHGLARAGHGSPDPGFTLWVGWCAFLAAFIPALDCLQRGQVGLLKTWLLLLGMRLVVERSSPAGEFLGGLVLALPCVIKVIPALPVGVFLLMIRGVRKKQGMAFREGGGPALGGLVLGGLLYLFVLPSALVGWQANLHHLKSWYEKVGHRSQGIGDTLRLGQPHTLRNQSLDNALFWLGNMVYLSVTEPDKSLRTRFYLIQDYPGRTFMAQALPRAVVKGLRLLLLLFLIPLVWRGARRGREDEALAVTGLACLAALVVSPVARGHYFMFLLPAWLFVPRLFYRHGRTRTARRLALAAPLLVIPHYVLLPYLGPVGFLGIGTVLWYLVAGALWMRLPAVVPATDKNRSKTAKLV